jgi:hypothetical protein
MENEKKIREEDENSIEKYFFFDKLDIFKYHLASLLLSHVVLYIYTHTH